VQITVFSDRPVPMNTHDTAINKQVLEIRVSNSPGDDVRLSHNAASKKIGRFLLLRRNKSLIRSP